jgi:HK97 gp10 family phage protein
MAKGLKRIKNMLSNRGKKINREADVLVKKTALVGRNVAVQKAPSAFGQLRQGISIKSKFHKAEVFSQAPYSVYVEFGTGKKVKIPSYTPAPLKKAAALMRSGRGGNFDDFLTRLSRWARLKGIPNEAIYPMALSILRNGVEPQPFMRPAYIASRKFLLSGLKKL